MSLYYCPLCNLDVEKIAEYYEFGAENPKHCCEECKVKLQSWYRIVARAEKKKEDMSYSLKAYFSGSGTR